MTKPKPNGLSHPVKRAIARLAAVRDRLPLTQQGSGVTQGLLEADRLDHGHLGDLIVRIKKEGLA
jgi:hypothetical protein